jgi:hypothetical protein
VGDRVEQTINQRRIHVGVSKASDASSRSHKNIHLIQAGKVFAVDKPRPVGQKTADGNGGLGANGQTMLTQEATVLLIGRHKGAKVTLYLDNAYRAVGCATSAVSTALGIHYKTQCIFGHRIISDSLSLATSMVFIRCSFCFLIHMNIFNMNRDER